MQYYVVTYTHTKLVGWAVFLYAHIAYLKKLVKNKSLQISGPGVGTPVRSAQLIFNVTDRTELDRLVAADPYSVHDLVASSTVNLWNVEWGSIQKPETPAPVGTKYFRVSYELKEVSDYAASKTSADAYFKDLLTAKKLRAAGPYENDSRAGLLILSVKDFSEAEEITKSLPFVEGYGASYKITQWAPTFGEF